MDDKKNTEDLLFPGCLGLESVRDNYHKDILRIKVENWSKVNELKKTHFYYFANLAQYLCKEAIEIYSEIGPPLRIPAILAGKKSHGYIREHLNMSNAITQNDLLSEENPFILGLITEKLLNLQEEVLNNKRPTFLVSINYHKNLIFNQPGLRLLNCDPKQMLEREIPSLWVPPGKIKPVNYRQQIPPHLDEIIKLLRQQSELSSHSYAAWRTSGNASAEWGRWTADIKLRDLGGGHFARLMINQGWDSII